jgi:N-acetylmuramoyl-L-alanine amidase
MNRFALLLCTLLLAACATAPRNPLARWEASKNYGPRQPVLIVLHATEQASVAESLATLRGENSTGPVSAHYLIGRDGAIYQLVSDQHRAWHAGAGSWGTITDVNSASLGIELDNDGRADFPEAQIAALLRLLGDLCERHRIPRTQVIAHADLAPTRKQDPSARFPWQRLAQAGFGAWPADPLIEPPPNFHPWLAMRAFGYPLADRAAALRAFRRRFRGADFPDTPLDEVDARLLYALTR